MTETSPLTAAVAPPDPTTLWILIIGLAIGTFLLRFVFVGFVGDRPMPEWLLRHLRYTAVAILPALVAPLVVWPAATGGQLDLPRTAAAAATIVAGWISKNVLIGIGAGAVTLYTLLYLLG
ncbi:AzlD domain-containing protein [Pseudodonghicola flavimaris]|uniref:AzlD domain-containing protein n=1 Tax=Pseudodonghicola flavimaris TaxID=3050036 RepID=A0ABT7EY06_9RHOB|nr:AzlD domain-containing protein [Pseudodonghicola flavimaris]MDK3017230.1 AzlD domain-containing protein [Pseudodonghicola flavimaris]